MSREIEFRAWLKAYKQMTKVLNIDFKLEAVHIPKIGMSYSMQFFEDIELMQYTGLKDKNGVKIFEGDIVRVYGYPVAEVIYDKESCSFKIKVQCVGGFDLLRLLHFRIPHIEVIGNIYENSELLGERYE